MLKEKLKNSKGITLIALIITVIVMLILVAVTVSIALNGGIFDQARTAAKDTKEATEKEIVQAALVGAYDAITGEIDVDKLEQNLKEVDEKWTATEGENSSGEKIITCLKQNDSADSEETTTTTVEVSMNGTITVKPDSSTNPEEPGTVDLSGTYYNGKYKSLLIENNIAYMYMGEEEDEVVPTDMSIDPNTKTLTIAMKEPEYENNQFTGEYVDTGYNMTLGYGLIEENGKVVNKVLIMSDPDAPGAEGIIWQNTKGFTVGEATAGVYVSGQDGDQYRSAYIVKPETLTVDIKETQSGQMASDVANWYYSSSGQDIPFFYYDGDYYLSGSNYALTVTANSIQKESVVYSKVSGN